jgi:hypothetical protein
LVAAFLFYKRKALKGESYIKFDKKHLLVNKIKNRIYEYQKTTLFRQILGNYKGKYLVFFR